MNFLLRNPQILLLILLGLYYLLRSKKKKPTPAGSKPIAAKPQVKAAPTYQRSESLSDNLGSLIKSLETSLQSTGASVVKPDRALTLLEQRQLREAAAAQTQSLDSNFRNLETAQASPSAFDSQGGAMDYDKMTTDFDQKTVDFDEEQQNFSFESAANVERDLKQAEIATSLPQADAGSSSSVLGDLFASQDAVRRAITATVILGKPVSMRR